MANFSAIAKGTRGRKAVELPIGDTKPDPTSSTGWSGDTITVDVRPLLPSEETGILERARAEAVRRGVESPADGDPIYDFAIQVETVLLACIDHDSPTDAPRPFFDGGRDQVVTTPSLTRDHIAFLFQSAMAWQTAVSPVLTMLTKDQFLEAVYKTAGGDMLPFLQLRPSMRWSFTRSLAELAAISLQHRSLSSSTSDAVPTSN